MNLNPTHVALLLSASLLGCGTRSTSLGTQTDEGQIGGLSRSVDGGGVPLCSPSGQPCAVLVDEEIPTPVSFRNVAPAIALDSNGLPHVLFSDNAFASHLASRNAAGAWTVENPGFRMAIGSLALDAQDAPFVLANDGASGVTVWSHSGNAWSKLKDFKPAGAVVNQLLFAPNGTLHAVFHDSLGVVPSLRHETWSPGAGWKSEPAPAVSTPRIGTVPATLTTDGHLSVALMSNTGFAWWKEGGTEELIEAATRGAYIHDPLLLDTSAADGQPRLLFKRQLTSPEGASDLVLAVRSPAGQWTTRDVALTRKPTSKNCSPPAPGGGVPGLGYCQQSAIDTPLALAVNAAGETRVVYFHLEMLQEFTCQTSPGGPGGCGYTLVSQTLDGMLHVWTDAGDVGQYPVAVQNPLAGTSKVDASGRIHIALYDGTSSTGFTVRYLVVGSIP